MPSFPHAAIRLPLSGCVLAVAAALVLSACGDGGSATAGDGAVPPAKTVTGQTERAAKDRGGSGSSCPQQLGAFVEALEALRSQLAVGLAYEQYVATVKGLRRAYGEIPVERLTFDCLATGRPSEQALNKHIDAANAWGKCLADASCTTATIEPVLQRKWRVASRHLSAAR